MSAKEMFEELGYKYMKNGAEIIVRRKDRQWREKGDIEISFDLQAKNIMFIFEGVISGNLPLFIEIEELQAINQQVEELGWNER